MSKLYISAGSNRSGCLEFIYTLSCTCLCISVHCEPFQIFVESAYKIQIDNKISQVLNLQDRKGYSKLMKDNQLQTRQVEKSKKLKGKVALIAGQQVDTLTAVATKVAARGADVALIYECTDPEYIDEIREKIESEDVRFALICTDWRNNPEVDQIVSYTTAVLGKPDIFIDLTTPNKPVNASETVVPPLSSWMMTQALIHTME